MKGGVEGGKEKVNLWALVVEKLKERVGGTDEKLGGWV